MPSYTLRYHGADYTIYGENRRETVHRFIRSLLDSGLEDFQPSLMIRQFEMEEWMEIDVKQVLINLGIESQRHRNDGTPWLQVVG